MEKKRAEIHELPAPQANDDARGTRTDLDMDELLDKVEEAAGLLGIMSAALNNQYFTDEFYVALKGAAAYCHFKQFEDLVDRALEAVERLHEMANAAYKAA